MYNIFMDKILQTLSRSLFVVLKLKIIVQKLGTVLDLVF